MSRRWGVFVHNIDGDSGDGEILGPYQTSAKAEEKAEAVRRESNRRSDLDPVEAIVLPISNRGVRMIVEAVQ